MLIHILLLATFVNRNPCFGAISIVNGNASSLGTNHSEPECTSLGTKSRIFHVGWPFKLTCRELAFKMFTRGMNDENVSCILQSMNGTEIWRIQGKGEDFTFPSESRYPRVELTGSTQFKLQLNRLDILSCGEFILNLTEANSNAGNYNCSTFSRERYIERKEKILTNVRLSCSVDSFEDPGLFTESSEVTYEWWYNCSKTLPKNVKRVDDLPEVLKITNATFENGGEYVCAVRFKDQIRYLSRINLCLKSPSIGKTSIYCPEKIKAKERSTLNITCHADTGIGQHIFFSPPRVDWFKKGSSALDKQICENWNQGISNKDKVLCEISRPKTSPNEKCYRYLPSPEEDTFDRRTHKIILQIKNFQQSDVGKYIMKFKYFSVYRSKTIEVSMDWSDTHSRNSFIVGASLISFFVIITFMAVCYWRRIDLLLMYKKYFAASETELKTYDAGLVYHYSNEDMSNESKRLTVGLIEALLDIFSKENMKVYDENKDDCDLYLRVQKIANVQSDCHFIVVVLNEEFVSEEWNMHKVQKALKALIENGMTVIFLPLPDFLKKLKNINDKSKKTLEHAMKIATTIKWSGKLPLEPRFKKQLKLAFPKIKHPNRENEQLLLESNM